MKAFADDKINVTEKLKFVLERVENIVGKGENAGYQHFLTMFSKGFFPRVIKSWDCVARVNPFPNKAWFLRVCCASLLKPLLVKGEIARNTQFLLFPKGFYPFGERSAIFIKFEIVICKLFHFERVQNLSFWKGLNDFQEEAFRNYCGKKRKCW